MSTVPRHAFSKLFQLCTGHGVLGKYFQMRYISKRNHYYECGQLETIEARSQGMSFVSCRVRLEMFSGRLIPILCLVSKRALGMVAELLSSLLQILC